MAVEFGHEADEARKRDAYNNNNKEIGKKVVKNSFSLSVGEKILEGIQFFVQLIIN